MASSRQSGHRIIPAAEDQTISGNFFSGALLVFGGVKLVNLFYKYYDSVE